MIFCGMPPINSVNVIVVTHSKRRRCRAVYTLERQKLARRALSHEPSSVVAGKNCANALASAIVPRRCRNGCPGFASWIGDVFGTRRRSTTPTPVLTRTRPIGPHARQHRQWRTAGHVKETNPPHRKEPSVRHIDATDHKTDGSHVVKILWENENDGERDLTVRMPAAEQTPRTTADVDLLPVPGEDPADDGRCRRAALEGPRQQQNTSTSMGTTSEASAPAPDHGHPH